MAEIIHVGLLLSRLAVGIFNFGPCAYRARRCLFSLSVWVRAAASRPWKVCGSTCRKRQVWSKLNNSETKGERLSSPLPPVVA